MLVNDKTTKSALERLAECYLKLFPGVFEGSRSGDYRFVSKLKDYNGSLEQAYATGDLVFIGSPGFVGYLENISYMNSICESILKSGGTPVFSVLPSLDPESGVAPNVNYSLLVNSSTENKTSAKLFIESAVGIESQYICGMPMGIPVNGELVGKMREFYEEAMLAGAGRIGCAWYVTLPGILPVMPVVLMLSLMNSYKIYREAYLIGGNYPDESIYLIQHFISNNFVNMNYSRLCAVTSLILFLALSAAGAVYLILRAAKGGRR